MKKDREQVLKMVQAGQISAEEAARLLEALDEADSTEAVETEEEKGASATDPPNASGWWLYPTAVGAVVMAMGAPLMALGLIGRSAVFWAICCGWIPFLVGLTILTLGVWSRGARWLHLRISNTRSGKRSFALSLPLPLTFSAWVLRMVRPFVPQFDDTAVDEAILALRDGLTEGDDQPVIIDVHDDQDGEHVQIYIG